ncbi:MAG: hypothetical protein OEZ06_21800 [Myxococcales bacterium]|nr:hypothetical protein [Myxococcales bacterium]
MVSKLERAQAADAIIGLLKQGDRDGARERTAAVFGLHLGRFCMAMLGTQADAERAWRTAIAAMAERLPELDAQGLEAALFEAAIEACDGVTSQRDAAAEDAAYAIERPDDRRLSRSAARVRDRARRTRAALRQIPQTQRQAALLRHVAGLEYEVVASLCDCSVREAKKRIGRGILGLRQALRGEGAEAGVGT